MKSVLITGATSGIGRATARLFASRGFFVFCHGKQSDSDFSIVGELGKHATKVVANLQNEKEIRTLFSNIPALDGLINNAGNISRKNPTKTSFAEAFAVNATAPFFCAHEAIKKGVRSIVNVGSIRGLHYATSSPEYSASKAALHNITACLAKKYAPNVRVNAVAPGFTRTKMTADNPERLTKEAAKTPLGRIADPEEIARAIFFFISAEASFVTGQLLVVDGGRTL